MYDSLKECTAIVTGAGSGIGKAMAISFAKACCKVVCVARRKATLDEVVAEITKAGGEAIAFAGDVTSYEQMQAMAKTAVATYGRIDILLSNAGVIPQVPLSEMTDKDFDMVMDINVKGMFHAIKAVMPYMKKQKYGRIILTSSITGPITGYPGWAVYGASKAAQLGFMRTAAMELAPLGQNYVDIMEKAVPVGKLGTGFDIANAAMFLALKESWYVNGHNLIIDGGQILPESAGALDEMRKLYEADIAKA